MSHDAELLARYAADQSETAFTELVQRHLPLVYSAALRLARGDAHRAQDVTQQVFTELARQADRLTAHPALAGWLYTTTRLMAQRALRTEQRRARREQEAHAMNELLRDSDLDPAWQNLRPVLDDAMHDLGDKDRLAVLLRFFQNKTFKEVGAALALNENAARMRVERALEKLRGHLARRGVTLTGSALGAVLLGHATGMVPATFAATVAGAALASTVAGSAWPLSSLQLLTMAKLKTGFLTALVAAGVITPLIIQRQSYVALRKENASLRQQLLASRAAQKTARPDSGVPTPRFPAPPWRAPSPGAQPPERVPTASLITRLLREGEAPKLTPPQLTTYLSENQRNAASLLAAYRTTGDPLLLQEAMQRYPEDPEVAFEAAFQKDASSEERGRWLDALKLAAPRNALADYLSAAHHLEHNRSDAALRDLITASGKPHFHDYTLDRVQADEEAFRAAGYSVAEAKAVPAAQLLLPQLAQMKALSQGLAELAKAYQDQGDAASAQAVLQMTAGLGRRYSIVWPGEPEVSQLVGIAIERNALRQMNPASLDSASIGALPQRLTELDQQWNDLQQLAKQTEALMPSMSDQDWISYKDRWRNFGEEAAGRWLINKYAPFLPQESTPPAQ